MRLIMHEETFSTNQDWGRVVVPGVEESQMQRDRIESPKGSHCQAETAWIGDGPLVGGFF
jgi:hypothetical protein